MSLPFSVIFTKPEMAFSGTTTFMKAGSASTTSPVTPLKVTSISALLTPKSVPLMVRVSPTAPLKASITSTLGGVKDPVFSVFEQAPSSSNIKATTANLVK